MEVNHVENVRSNKKLNSIFTLFSNLTGENNDNPKYCIELMKSLQRDQYAIGHTDNFEYSVKRVVRALGSTRLHSQCGCFACLVCMLKYKVCTVDDVLKLLEKEEKQIRGATKLEVKAFNMAVILTSGAIIHSGLFFEQSPGVQKLILQKLIEGGKKKSYLFSIVCRFLIESIMCIDESLFKDIIWPFCRTEVLGDLTNCNLDTLHLLIVCMIKSPDAINKFLRKNKQSDTLILEEVAKFTFSNSVRSNHPIYETFAEILSKSSENLKTIWPKCVEKYGKINSVKNNLLVALFFQITKYLKDVDVVPFLLVPKFIDILITVLNFKKTKLVMDCNYNSMAESALNSIEKLFSQNSSSNRAKLDTIKRLLLFPANLKFELKTGNKIIQRLVSQLNSDAVAEIFELYRGIIQGDFQKISSKEGIKENWNSKEKQIALLYLIKTINHSSIKNNVNIKLQQMKFLFDLAFLNEEESISDSDFKKYGQECFYKAIMLQMPSLKDLVYLLNELAAYANQNIINGNFKIDQEIREWWSKQYLAVQKLQSESNNKFFITVHVLLLYMGFQLFIDLELAKSSIEELLSCYSHLKNAEEKDKKLKKKKDRAKDSTIEEPHWTEVTVDLILSLLSRENKLWRHVISCIFPQVVIHSTPSTLRQIIDALDPKSQEVVLEEFSSGECDSESEETESESSLSVSGESDLEDCDQEKANDQLRSAVREALGYSAAFTDDESIDMDQMNSEEEKKLNESLSEAFKLYKSGSRGKKKKQTKEEEALMHFRLRVLDLVEIYLINSPSMQGCLDLILPLLNVLEFSIKDQHQNPLRIRADSILKCLCSVKHFSVTDNIDSDKIKELFQAVVDRKDVSALLFVEMSPRIADCAGFLVRCCQFLSGSEAQECLVAEYVSLLKSFCISRDFRLPVSMFQNVLRTTWKGNLKLARTLFDCLALPNTRIFKKMKLLELLKIFYKNEKLHISSDELTKSELTEIETNFVETFVDYLKNYKKNESKATEKMYVTFFSQLIVLINIARTNATRHRPNEKEGPPWKNVILALATTDTCNNTKKTRMQIANAAHLLNVSLPARDSEERKRKTKIEVKTSEEEVDDHFKEPKKKKKRKSDFKKESRRLREEISTNGYANEVGESFRPLIHKFWVNASYGIASLYVLADTIDKTLKANEIEKSKLNYEKSKVAMAAIDTLIWQGLASIIIPGFTINRICALTLFSLSKFTKLETPTKKWTTTAIGLGSIPFIVTPIDNFVDALLNKTLRPFFR